MPGFTGVFVHLILGSRVPHVGWNFLRAVSDSSSPRLLRHLVDQRLFISLIRMACLPTPQPLFSRVYRHESTWLGLVEKGSVFGVQFHPEKSRSQGLHVLRNFLIAAGRNG